MPRRTAAAAAVVVLCATAQGAAAVHSSSVRGGLHMGSSSNHGGFLARQAGMGAEPHGVMADSQRPQRARQRRRRQRGPPPLSCAQSSSSLSAPPAARFPRFPKSLDEISREMAGALVDAARASRGPRLLVDLRLPELARERNMGATEGDESLLLLDVIRGTSQNLAVKGFTKVRVCFNTLALAASAREFFRDMNPFIVRIDALGAAQVAADDEMLLLVRPNNAVTWKKLEQVQELLVQATNKGVCVAMVNPELQSYAAVNGTACRPMVLSDFAATFCIDPAAL